MTGHISLFVLEDGVTDAYRNYHLTCDDNLTRHRGEIFLVDRTTIQSPLKILDIPIYKYWYGKLNKINSQLSQ